MNPLRAGMILGTILLASCNNVKKQYTANELLEKASQDNNLNAGRGKFSIDAPTGWQKSDTAVNGIQIIFFLGPTIDNGFRENMNVLSESMQGRSLDSYFYASISSMGNYLQNFSAGAKGELDIDGIHCKWLQYTHQLNGFDIDVIWYVIPKNGIAYLITCSALKGRIEAYRAKFEEAIKTFRLS